MHISCKPDHDAGELNEGQEAGSEFAEASGNAPVLFELLKEALDQMALLVKGPVARPGFLVCLGRDTVIRARRGNEIADCLRAVGLVCNHDGSIQRHGRQRCFCIPGIVEVARRQVNVDRIPQAVNDRVDFRCLSASTDPDMLVYFPVYRPFFAPAPCWCASTLVLSMLMS